MALSVLVVDADPQRRDQVRTLLEFMEYEVLAAAAPADLGTSPAEVAAVFLGSGENDEQCLEWIRQLRIRFPETTLLLLGESVRQPLSPEIAGEIGAVTEWPLRQRAIRVLLDKAALPNPATGPARRSLDLFRSLVGDSPGIVRIRQLIEQVANSGTSVLILGEPGTGKEVAARKLHYFSNRRDKPFVRVQCATIAPDVLESKLFGQEPRGDHSARPGHLELAAGGTLFLDEIGALGPTLQARLWRTLQGRVFDRPGSARPVPVDVRVIASSSQDLQEQVRLGRFREDLFQHLQVMPISMPPLRERTRDIPFLIEELILRCRNEHRAGVRLTRTALDALVQYSWPGNLRELASLVERLAILQPNGTVDLHDLPDRYMAGIALPAAAVASAMAPELTADPASLPRLPREGLDIKEHLNQLEYTLIKQALDEAGGVVAHAAARLRLRRTTLVEKLRKYGISRNVDEASNF